MRALLCLAAVLSAAALGSSGGIAGTSAASLEASHAADPGAAREHQMKAIVREWSKRLNANDNAGVARLFRVPATIVQGRYLYRLTTREQITQWHAGLPCAGRVLSIKVKGAFATAVFRLSNRGSKPCDAPGELAAARFKIADGKIVSWQQVPVPPKQQEPTGPSA
jgi:ketosteroid isomerase-like protein